jgi:flagellar biosynthetic protein FliR
MTAAMTTALGAALEPRLILFGLVLTRVGGVFLALPMLSGEIVPLRLRAALACAFAFALSLAVSVPRVPSGPAQLVAAAAVELLVGAGLGLLVRLALAAAEALGALISMQMGLGFGALVDPLTQAEGPLGGLFGLIAWMLLLAADGHHQVLLGLADSLRALPPGAALAADATPFAEPFARRLAESGGTMFSAALRIATPVIGAVLGTNACLALLARVAPKVNLMMLGFLIAAFAGLLALALAGPSMARNLHQTLGHALDEMRGAAVQMGR